MTQANASDNLPKPRRDSAVRQDYRVLVPGYLLDNSKSYGLTYPVGTKFHNIWVSILVFTKGRVPSTATDSVPVLEDGEIMY